MATANGRARSFSAPVVALLNASQQGNGVPRRGAGGAGLPRQGGQAARPHSTAGSSPLLAIRSSMHHHHPKTHHLHNSTSFPTVVIHDVTGPTPPSISALATRRASRLIDNRIRTVSVSSTSARESLEMKCCRINVLLVTMQFCLGVAVTGLGLYMQTLSPSLGLRDCPFWAGAPLLLAGIVGIYFCATDFSAYQGSTKAYAIKVICFILSGSCVFLCMIGSVFPGIHGSRISTFSHCNTTELTCYCSKSADPSAQVYVYLEVGSCSVLQTSVKDYLILECALNAIASGVCLWFVTLLWKSKYSDYYSGLRFFSYSADVPTHHWRNNAPPPYLANTEPPSPIHAFYKPHSKRTPPRSDTDMTEVDVQRPLHGDDT